MPSDPALQFDAVSKHYPGVRALTDVSFSVAPRSVHALLGENGAGKSTLLKALSGAHQPTSGTLRIGDQPRVFRTTGDAIAAGVAVIYQELHLVPEMSVAENLFLGHMPNAAGFVNRRELLDRSRALLQRFGEDINPRTRLGRLPIGQRQMIEIAKALSRGAKTIAFDEPTSSLSAREIDKLFTVIRDLRDDGCAILYVTHRMEEVYALCDAATVFRDGRHVVTWDALKNVTPDMIVKAMVGRELADVYRYAPRPHGSPALELKSLTGPGLTAPATLSVAKGEILGLFGLVGAGRSELMRLASGAVRKASGETTVWGAPVTIRNPRDAIRAGLLFAPEDRKKDGIVPVRSVKENLNISARRKHVIAGTIVNEAWESRNVRGFIDKLRIRTSGPKQLISNLSGGNQQKVILARWLSEDVKVILLDEPTRGIDIGARSEIYAIIYDLAKSGVGVIVVSSDLPEILGVSDRVLIMRQGKIAGELKRDQFNQETALKLALPVSS